MSADELRMDTPNERGKRLIVLDVQHLMPILRGETATLGLPKDAVCLRCYYDINKDRLLLLVESETFAPTRDGELIPVLNVVGHQVMPDVLARFKERLAATLHEGRSGG